MDAKDVGEVPHAKGVGECSFGADAEDVSEAPCAKFWWRQVVVVAEDIDEDILSVLTTEMLEKTFYLLASKVSYFSHRRQLGYSDIVHNWWTVLDQKPSVAKGGLQSLIMLVKPIVFEMRHAFGPWQ